MPYANPNAPKGGTLSLAAQGTFNAANKWMTTGVAMAGTNYLYDTMMSGSLNEASTMYPQLAEKVTYDPDDKSWVIYHLHPDATFWDGSSVTAKDVKATFHALLDKGPMYIRGYLADIKAIEAVTDKQVKFYFKNSDNPEILLSVAQFPIFKQASVDEYFDKITLTPLVGSGAYQLDKIDAGRMVRYKRDPNYWGQNLMINRGRYNFDYIKYVYYLSNEIAFEGFKAGQYQYRQENKARNWATAYHFPAVQNGHIIKESIENRNPVTMQGLVLNLRRPLFQDIRVRQALTYAFDFEWMNNTLFYGQHQRLQSYFYHSELEATGTPNAAEMAIITPLMPKIAKNQQQAVLNEWRLPTSDGKGYHRQGLLAARQKLLDAGFYYQNMQLYTPKGEPAKFEVLLRSGSAITRIILPYVKNLKRLGFDVSIREVDAPQYIQRVRDYDYDTMVDMFMQGLSPGAEQHAYWGSQSADEPGNQNTAGIKNPAIDAVIEGLANAQTREGVITHAKVLDRLLRAGYYIVPMYGKTSTTVAYWQQYRHAKLPTNAVGIDYWWAEPTQ